MFILIYEVVDGKPIRNLILFLLANPQIFRNHKPLDIIPQLSRIPVPGLTKLG